MIHVRYTHTHTAYIQCNVHDIGMQVENFENAGKWASPQQLGSTLMRFRQEMLLPKLKALKQPPSDRTQFTATDLLQVSVFTCICVLSKLLSVFSIGHLAHTSVVVLVRFVRT